MPFRDINDVTLVSEDTDDHDDPKSYVVIKSDLAITENKSTSPSRFLMSSSPLSAIKNMWKMDVASMKQVNSRVCCHEAIFSKTLGWVFFCCLFMYRNGTKI